MLVAKFGVKAEIAELYESIGAQTGVAILHHVIAIPNILVTFCTASRDQNCEKVYCYFVDRTHFMIYFNLFTPEFRIFSAVWGFGVLGFWGFLGPWDIGKR